MPPFVTASLLLVLATQESAPLDLPARLSDRPFSGEPHTYSVRLVRNHALIGRVEQKGVDLVVRIRDPRGRVVFEVDSPNGADGPEPIAWIASADGDYRLEIHPFEPAPAGTYDLVVDAPRPATIRDRELTEALSLYLTAFRERGEALRLQAEGQFARSHALYFRSKTRALKALTMRTRRFGAGAIELVPVHQLLGLIDDEIGEYRSGAGHFATALEILERTHGPEHPSTITTRSDLGHLKLAAGDYAGATAIFESVLAYMERAADQGRIANALVALGDTLARDGQLDRAEAALRRAVKIRESIAGPEHHSTANALISLGTILVDRGSVDDGEAICTPIAARLDRATGQSFHRASVNRCLAKGAARRRDFSTATARARSMADILEAAYGPDAPPTAEGLALLGSVLVDAGDLQRGRQMLQRALKIQRQRLGELHPSTQKTITRLNRPANR